MSNVTGTQNMLDFVEWQKSLTEEVREQILGFWMKHAVDEKNGGFIGHMASDGSISENADKGLVLNARILWSFSSAYRIYKEAPYLELAERALGALREHFHDQEYGGLYWMVDKDGQPVQTKKQVYGQAFVIYALAEYVRATGKQDVLPWAEEIYRLLEKHAFDPVHLGYIEALAQNWQETDDLSLSGKDLNERKSMNTHLHVLEAYTNLYRVWKSEGLRDKLKTLIELHLDYIIDPQSHHFKLFFDDAWNSKSRHVSYGHDIEGSWLLWEAAEVLGDKALEERVREAAIQMAHVTLAEGVDVDGGVYNEADGDGHLDAAKDWWPQAEAMVGFLNAYELTQEERYLNAAWGSWQFIAACVSDKETGEWHWQVSREGVADTSYPKIDPWKCPYHNSRACFEAIERLERIKINGINN
ncbi:AGE family epimerase/isomerase [Paenibacillus sp. Leaf72]|uniref:AGE family epimerase/isomerase n=1 Tax=Paenibacillus sp. Leaf72 TaxID=1736234 RepID=UPI0009D789D8|nr:AGE family epimerase/isomerase [Paenibacillus sp. Leaf72]